MEYDSETQEEELQNKTGNKQTVTVQTQQNKCTLGNMLPNTLHIDFYPSLNFMVWDFFWFVDVLFYFVGMFFSFLLTCGPPHTCLTLASLALSFVFTFGSSVLASVLCSCACSPCVPCVPKLFPVIFWFVLSFLYHLCIFLRLPFVAHLCVLCLCPETLRTFQH